MNLSHLVDLGRGMGAEWYARAHADIVDIGTANHWPPVTFAAILAITSPRVTLRRNIRYTFEWLANSNPLDMIATVRAALDHYEKTRQIRGPKTSAFKACLLGCPDSLVLDVWMAKVFDVSQQHLYRRANYATIRRTCERLGRKHRLSIAQVQASLWSGIQIAGGRKAEHFPLREEFSLWQKHGYRFPLGTIESK